MPCHVELHRPAFWVRVVSASLIALGAAGCSTDSTRLIEDGYGPPTASVAQRPQQTAAYPPAHQPGMNRVETQPLPQVQAGHLPPPPAAPQASRYQVATAHTIGPATHQNVAPGGQYRPRGQGATDIHVVAPGETLMQVSRIHRISVAELARANDIPPDTRVKVGDRLVIPRGRATTQVASIAPTQRLSVRPTAPQPAPKAAAEETPPNARTAAATAAPETQSPAKIAEPVGGMPSFRWPVRGRIIAGFGPKPNGLQNDGINLAVPEGTPVKSAEDGVVAYAGNELKGYGNLVLVRHSNGFVTAYAHASEILVKRGDTIKRGQVIAKSGQTGNVSSPQLHFEIRKGSTPVDPTQYLSGA
jgi:murein DD-endopeptidase MepM/ murein hydrolase activator NlpD